jgi:hypothetical protein
MLLDFCLQLLLKEAKWFGRMDHLNFIRILVMVLAKIGIAINARFSIVSEKKVNLWCLKKVNL